MALSLRFDTRELMDAVFTVAEFTMVAGTVNSLNVEVDDWLNERLPSAISQGRQRPGQTCG